MTEHGSRDRPRLQGTVRLSAEQLAELLRLIQERMREEEGTE